MPLRVLTVGVEVPDDFPQKPYDAIHACVNSRQRHPESLFHYGGAWNAVAYRFVSCARSDEAFASSVRSAQSHAERFNQEEALFGFFVNGLSVIESFFYGLYWIGSMVDAILFPVRSGDDLREIQLHKTVEAYITRFGSSPLISAFGRLRYRDSSGNWKNTSEYEEWKDVRNILAHRAAYGRMISAGVGGGHQVENVWRVRNIPLNDQLTTTRRQWLASTLRELMLGVEDLANANL